MTAADVISGSHEGAVENAEQAAYANVLFQEAIRLGMDLNNRHHTPEEIRKNMREVERERGRSYLPSVPTVLHRL